MRIIQVHLQCVYIDFCKVGFLTKYLMINYSKEGRSVHTMCRANLIDCLLSHTNTQSKSTDDLNSLLFVRH